MLGFFLSFLSLLVLLFCKKKNLVIQSSFVRESVSPSLSFSAFGNVDKDFNANEHFSGSRANSVQMKHLDYRMWKNSTVFLMLYELMLYKLYIKENTCTQFIKHCLKFTYEKLKLSLHHKIDVFA